jgi:hypothetical protein
MAEWPDAAELKRVLNFEPETEDDPLLDTLDRVLASAIQTVKEVRGNWDEYEDEPDDKLAQAALRMAELISERPDADRRSLIADPTFTTLMHGRRRVFGVA